jgi:heat shock protein HslJ
MSGNTLAIGNLVTTLMFCPEPGVMDLETTYLEFLPRITRYSISGNELTLSDANGTINMVYDTTPG